jgi:hypothetical protein
VTVNGCALDFADQVSSRAPRGRLPACAAREERLDGKPKFVQYGGSCRLR